jgi:predicted DNA-binding transcriptional regulator AlpA
MVECVSLVQLEPEFLCEREVSSRYSISQRTLQHWRLMRQGPKWYRVTTGLVRYKVSDIEAWLAKRAVDPIGPASSSHYIQGGEMTGPPAARSAQADPGSLQARARQLIEAGLADHLRQCR